MNNFERTNPDNHEQITLHFARKERWRRQTPALGILLSLLLLGCGKTDHAETNTNSEVPKQTETPVVEKPRIDVIFLEIKAPQRVKKNQSFKVTISAKNNNLTGSSAPAVNVTIRARTSGLTGATDLVLGTIQFRELAPQQTKKLEAEIAMGPNRPGMWTLYVIAKPFGYVDDKNNTVEARLVVDD